MVHNNEVIGRSHKSRGFGGGCQPLVLSGIGQSELNMSIQFQAQSHDVLINVKQCFVKGFKSGSTNSD